MRIRPTLIMAACAVLLTPLNGAAQRASLDQVESHIAAGRIDQARTALEQWKKGNRADARSTYLTARLSTRVEDAEDAYLSVALSHPTSAYAAESLLRLGQARMAAGDTKQAAVYFRRLLADYPGSEHRVTAEEWLSRTAAAAPAPARPTTAPTTKPTASPTTSPTTSTTTPARAAAQRGRFAIQVAAFRERSGARSVARELTKAGFGDVRLVTVPENSLIRVRVGSYENSAATSSTVSKLKAAGFSAVVVADVEREQLLRD